MRNVKMKRYYPLQYNDVACKGSVLDLKLHPKLNLQELTSLQGMQFNDTLLLLEQDLGNFLYAPLTKGYNWNLGR